MNRFIFTLIIVFSLNNCSLNENSRLWKDKENKFEKDKKIIKDFFEDQKIVSEFNQNLRLDLSSIDTNTKIIYNQNNLGSQKYNGELKKVGSFKFSKLDEVNKIDFKPIFFKNGIIFFDKKGTIIKYDKNQKVIWKKNHYSKSEKKLNPKLNFYLDNQNLLVADNIAKNYSINLTSGELNWSKTNNYRLTEH